VAAATPTATEPGPAGRAGDDRHRRPALPAHLARLGAALIRPRAAVRARLNGGPGGLAELLPWTLLAAGAARPGGLGQSLLIARTDLLAGLLRLAGVWSELVAPVLLGVVVVSVLAPGRSRSRVDGGDAFDAACLALVPLVLMVSVGALLEAVGASGRWLPNRLPRGTDPAALTAAGLRYGWSFAILGLTLWEAGRRSSGAAEGGEPEAARDGGEDFGSG